MIQSPVSILFDSNGIAINVKNNAIATRIQGENNTKYAKVTDSGQLMVLNYTITPPGVTTIIKTGYGNVSGNSYEDETFVIPNGETFTLTYFAGGGHPGTSDYSVIRLIYSASGVVDNNSDLLEAAFTPGNVRAILNENFVGNGTAAIILRRERLNAGTHELFGKFKGYY